MKRRLTILFVVVLALLLAVAGAVAQSPQARVPQTPLGPGFTYQGQLRDANGPVPGPCDLQFSLWDAAGSGSPPSGGAQIGVTHSPPPVTVTNGLFTVEVNANNEFGGSAFTGEERWLQVAVRCPAGSGSYATLSPRQKLTAAPYALSLKPDATINGLNNTGNLSFGATTRQMLNLWGTQYGIGVQSYDAYFRTDSGAGFAWFAGGEHSNLHYNPGTLGTTLMTLDSDGGLTVSGKVSASVNSASPGAAVSAANTGSGYGVYGASDLGAGVIGEGGTHGVLGVANSATSVGVLGTNTSLGGDGVRGESAGCIFPEGCSAGAGVRGVNTSIGAGVHGEGSSVGVLGYASSSTGAGVIGSVSNCSPGGNCYGVFSDGNFAVGPGYTKSAIVGTADYGDRQLYSIESPGNWFEDFGVGQLVDGIAVIQIDPIFAQTVNLSQEYHVFTTPRNGYANLYVTNFTPTSFEVRDADGKASLSFSYRIIAKRSGFEDIRLSPAGSPAAITASKP